VLNVKGALGALAVVGVVEASSATRRVRVSSWVVRKSWVGFVRTSMRGWWDKGLEGWGFRGEGMVDS